MGAIALIALIGLLFLNMNRPVASTDALEKGILSSDRGVSVEIAHRGGKGGSWVKTLKNGKLAEKVTGIVYDISVESVGIGEVQEYSLKLSFDKRLYISEAWCGNVEIHQDSKGKVQTLDLRNRGQEEIVLEHISEGKDIFIPLEPGDYIIYYPSVEAGEIPLAQNQHVDFGMILYSPSLGGAKFGDCSISYVINSDKENTPEYYLLLMILGILAIVLMYFGVTFVQKIQAQFLYEKEKAMVHETMSTFVGFVDAKDPYTAGHSERVADYTKLIAEKIGYSKDEALQAYYCGLLHDSGKISVSEVVLNKPGKLDPDEFESIKQHTIKGAEILRNLKTVPLASVAARNHHERYDGYGYPDKLSGEQIPEIARIICVADAFDAMNSNRVYRRALQSEDIIEQLRIHKGKQFDPKITDVFLEILESGAIDGFNRG